MFAPCDGVVLMREFRCERPAPRDSLRHMGVCRVLLIGASLTVLAGLASGLRTRDLVLYNHSPSLPVGFYLRTDDVVKRGAVVTVRAIDVVPAYAALRRFTGQRDRFIKRVAAGAGDTVCAESDAVEINARTVAYRVKQDNQGRVLPTWTGCITLSATQMFLMGDTADSFDGRYWGPIDVKFVEGVWRPL